MGKRLAGIITLCLITFGLAGTGLANAKTIKQPYLAEQAKGKAPAVKVYMTGSKMKSSVTVAGQVKEIPLRADGDIVSFQKSGEGLHSIILLDNSGSVDEVQFQECRKRLVSLCKAMGKQDTLTIYTVGTYRADGSKKAVVKNLKGSDKKGIKKALRKITAIPYLNSKKSKTVLYRSLNEVLAAQRMAAKRTVVLLLTDGEDDSKGKDIDKKSTADEVKNAMVPVYGILLHNVAKKQNKAKMKYTQYQILAEKNCRGYYEDCSSRSSAKTVAKAFKTLDTLLRKQTYVVTLRADSNRTVGQTKLQLTVNNKGIDPVAIDYSDYEKDGDAPILVGSVGKVSSNAIRFALQDANGVNADDVNDKSHFVVQTKTDKGDGEIWTIKDISTKSTGGELTVTLTLDKDLYTDSYCLVCNDIRDNSQDANAMSNVSAEFSVEDGLDRAAAARKEFIKSYWWIGLILLVVVLGIIIITVIRRRPQTAAEMDPEELHKADTKTIRLTITDRSGAIKDVEWNVEGSLFIGRSAICNIYFDDDRLSKQHFVIEVNKMGCYIEDLESTNGTFVNGIKMTSRRLLLDGDVINAGREKFVFHVPKNQPIIDSHEDPMM